jgi:hypothetical protein
MNDNPLDYYYVYVWGFVEPELIGPFSTFDEMRAAAAAYKKKIGRDGFDAFFHLTVPKGLTPEIGSFVNSLDDDSTEDGHIGE